MAMTSYGLNIETVLHIASTVNLYACGLGTCED